MTLSNCAWNDDKVKNLSWMSILPWNHQSKKFLDVPLGTLTCILQITNITLIHYHWSFMPYMETLSTNTPVLENSWFAITFKNKKIYIWNFFVPLWKFITLNWKYIKPQIGVEYICHLENWHLMAQQWYMSCWHENRMLCKINFGNFPSAPKCEPCSSLSVDPHMNTETINA